MKQIEIDTDLEQLNAKVRERRARAKEEEEKEAARERAKHLRNLENDCFWSFMLCVVAVCAYLVDAIPFVVAVIGGGIALALCVWFAVRHWIVKHR